MKILNKKITNYQFTAIALVLFRAFLNAFVPLMDKTEARYANIARIMAETNNWITPQIDYGVPFWAKPPLSTWLSAISIKIFGINEFAVRFPYLLLSIFMALLIGKYAKRKGFDFFIPAFILFTIPEFLIHAGVVSTDTALAFCVALVMISFWEGFFNKTKTYWKYLFFVGIGLGLLAKGPIIIILTGPPIFIWLILSKQFKNLWKTFPWIVGSLLTIVIALPWYILAEIKTPGFIDYFIVGEHFKRFLSSGWKGDKYGFPKSQPLGMIWVFLFLFTIPFLQLLIAKLWKNRKGLLKNNWVTYLLLWLLWTPLFFTVSKSLIHPYIMPVMVPLALLVTHFWETFSAKKIVVGSLIFPGIALLLFIGISFTSKMEFYANTDKYFIEHHLNDAIPIYHWNKKSYSGQFYSKGKIEFIKDETDLKSKIAAQKPFLLIIKKKNSTKIQPSLLNFLVKLEENKKKIIYQFNPNVISANF